MAIIGNNSSDETQIEIGFINNRIFTYNNGNSSRIIPSESIYNKAIEFESQYNSSESYKKTIIIIDDKMYENTSNYKIGLYNNTDLLLLCVNYGYYFLGKVYELNFFIDDQLVSNFIPALDNNGVPCLYDTVSGETFYNAGTGDFIYQLKE